MSASVMSGVCRVCRCTDEAPCVLNAGGYVVGDAAKTCVWIDDAHTLCSSPTCVAEIPMSELCEMTLSEYEWHRLEVALSEVPL